MRRVFHDVLFTLCAPARFRDDGLLPIPQHVVSTISCRFRAANGMVRESRQMVPAGAVCDVVENHTTVTIISYRKSKPQAHSELICFIGKGELIRYWHG